MKATTTTTPRPTDGLFARNLKFWRETSGLSEKAAAQKLGVSAATWSQWERRKREPRMSMAPMIAQVLGVRPCCLSSRDPERCVRCLGNGREERGQGDSQNVNSSRLPSGARGATLCASGSQRGTAAS
jgi:transcriptional regulator with XRE-family HTH domain